MKAFTFFSLLALSMPFMATAQNQNLIVDDVYFNPGNPQVQTAVKQISNTSTARPNYKNGAKEIVYKERNIKYPTIIKDTVYVDGQSPDGKSYHTNNQFDISKYDGHTNPVLIHDTIYISGFAMDSISNDQNQGYYLNGFNGNDSDKEYAERIRRFHNPKYSIFIGDPRYNNIYFLNSSDWNVYVDDSYAYVTPTWTNPNWWNYNSNPYGYGYGYSYGGWGHGWGSSYYGYGGMYSPWGYDSYYGYAGMYGYGNYWDPYGYGCYGGYYGNYGNYGYGYGTYWDRGHNRSNSAYNENDRRERAYSTGNTRSANNGVSTNTRSTLTNSGGVSSSVSRNPYTIVSGANSGNGANSRLSTNTTGRSVSNQANGIGLIRNSSDRSFNNSTIRSSDLNSNSRTSTINTQPRTYRATSNSVPTGNYVSRDNATTESSFRNTSSSITRSSTNDSRGTVSSPSRGSYSSGNSSGVSRSSSSSTYSAPSSSSYSSGSSSSYSSGSSSSGSSSSGGGSRSSSSGGSSGRR